MSIDSRSLRSLPQQMRARGFTFIEILVAMLVLGVAVLAFAGLQVRALETTSVSHLRSQAMTLAADLSERMRANGGQMAAYRTAANFNGPDQPAGAPADWVSPGDGCMRFSDVNSNGCTPAQMALFDINEVEYLANQLLPDGTVAVAPCDGLVGVDCVAVGWAGTDAADCESNATANCIVMQVVVL